jgi:hypothetical protein
LTEKVDDFGDYDKLKFDTIIPLNTSGPKHGTFPGPLYVVYDGFYSDPDAIRKEALSLDYVKTIKNNYVGQNSNPIPKSQNTLTFINSICGLPLIYSPTGYNGFRIAYENSIGRSHVHVDEIGDYGGVCYLTKPEYCKGGTAFFRHIQTGLDYIPWGKAIEYGYEDDKDMAAKFADDTMNPDAWEIVGFVPAAYNRFVLFRSAVFHAAWPGGFGSSYDDCRLARIMFFSLQEK